MREKILRLMKSESLTSSRLAEILEVQPSGISHILSGRNKPSFDMIQKILRRFPRINPDWLLLDSEKMYRDDAQILDLSVADDSDIFSSTQASNLSSDLESKNESSQKSSSINNFAEKLTNTSTHQKQIRRAVLFFEDGTFESYTI